MAVDLTIKERLDSARKHLDTLILTARQLPTWQRDLMENTLADFSRSMETLQALAEELRGRTQTLDETRLALEAEKQRQQKLLDLSQQKQTEDALRKSEERYRRLLGSVTDYVYTVEIKNNHPVSTNHGPGCVAVTGYTAEEYAADPQLWLRMVYKQDQKSVLRQARRALGGDAQPLEHRIIHKDGGIRWVRNTPVPRYNDQGRLAAYDGLITDVTARVEAERELRESEEKYRTLFEASTDAIFVETLDNRILDCNASSTQMYGYTKDELLKLKVQDLVPAKISENLEAVNQELIREGRVFFETSNIRKNGETFPCEVNVTTTTIGGQPRVITYVRDITKRKQAEQALQLAQAELEQRVQQRTAELRVTVQKLECEVEDRQHAELALAESQRFLQLVLDCLPTPVFYKDTEGRFLGCNQAFEKYMGYPRSDIIGHTLYDLAPEDLALEDLAAENTAADQALFRELEEQVYESTVSGADGVRHNVVFNKAPFFNPDGSLGGLVGSVFDITERKRMETYMMRTERLAAMGSIAASLAHEIKNPLQTIQSNVELVLDYDLDPEEHDEYLRLCYREIERLIEITSRLLNLALPRREATQPVSIPEQIQHVLSLVARSLENARVQVTTEISPDLPSEAMPEQVIEVLLNLIINAIEALPEGGEIYIAAWSEGQRANIAVKNSGPHIADEHLDRIFEPFFTTKPLGTGLGLPISYNILEQLGGNLYAENLPDGVQFIISLPLETPQRPGAAQDAANREE